MEVASLPSCLEIRVQLNFALDWLEEQRTLKWLWTGHTEEGSGKPCGVSLLQKCGEGEVGLSFISHFLYFP